ncbi:MAG: hypothetical protein ABI706_03780 [Ilumatobacteraceae bacterium]
MNDQYDRFAISPAADFDSRLWSQLEARLGADQHHAAGSPKQVEILTIETGSTDARHDKWRLGKIALALAASIALVLAAAVMLRHDDNQRSSTELRDVDPAEALPLGRRAFITADALGSRWREQEMFTEAVYTEQTAATIAALPECADLTATGLFTPTTKSVAARQSFSPGRNFVGHTVFVFATEEDASRAMDVINGDVYPNCSFNFFDRLIPLGSTLGTDTSTSEAWDAPAFTAHGERLVVIGQHAKLVGPDATVDAYFVNAYVQVGRAISWINPMASPTAGDSQFAVNKAITATATALDAVFGH